MVASAGKASTPNLVYLDPGAPAHAFLDPAEVPGAPVAPAATHAETPSPPRSPFFYGKWTASGAAVVMLGASVAFALGARAQADTLQAQAVKSQSGDCPPFGPPCQQYSAPFKEVEQTGKSYQRWSNVLLVGGAATAVAAGVFWYLDTGREDRPRAAPMVGGGTVGATAVVPF